MTYQQLIQKLENQAGSQAVADAWAQHDETREFIENIKSAFTQFGQSRFEAGEEAGQEFLGDTKDEAFEDGFDEGQEKGLKEGEVLGLQEGYVVGYLFGQMDAMGRNLDLSDE